MLNLLNALRQDEHGVILSTEIVIIGSLLVIGLITGLTCLQKSVNGELHDLAGAIGALDQTYSFSAHRKPGNAGQCCAYTAGSAYRNCENQDQKCGDIVGCVDNCQTPSTGCGSCGSCSSCTGAVASGHVCGSCGGRGTGCSTCGSGVQSRTNDVRCIDTGVPGMKVTEWRGLEHSNPVPEVVYPSSEAVRVSPHSGHAHPSEPVIQYGPGTEPHAVPQNNEIPPVPAGSLIPVPETQSLPAQPSTT